MLLKKAKDNPDWLQNTLIWFVGEQKQRALTGEDLNLPSRITIRALKLFCEMDYIILNWFTPVILLIMYYLCSVDLTVC
jgi:hypothetical protein